ncbi:MAG: isoprenyl transferase [Deltaproteobacteria bacterium]|nr:isoprenyl transferase [Deltaproteobacteria bacterium]
MKSDNNCLSINSDKLPMHVAIIMDGNGRWAKKKLKNRIEGHKKGAAAVRDIVSAAGNIGINILTLYAFSTENWQRPRTEVNALMKLLENFFISERDNIIKNKVKLQVIGQIWKMPKNIQAFIKELADITEKNTGLILNLALSYGGREDILSAFKKIIKKIKSDKLKPDEINEETISSHLYTAGLAEPDLLIRTGGEMRVSNFLLWQIAYSELYISKTLWPDFNKEEFFEIIKAFRLRERRFGKVAE